MHKLLISVIAAGAILLSPWPTRAAILYMNPQSGTFQPGDTVVVDVRLDTQGENLNAADISIGYPKNILEVVDISRGDSIFPIWIQAPKAKNDFGLITMIGGVPGGYSGRTPGDPALTNVIVKIVFRVLNGAPVPSTAKVAILPDSRVVRNDGSGSEAKLTAGWAEFNIAATGKAQANSWTEMLRGDKTPPEPFNIEVQRDRTVFENKYFAVFSTVDKQSGLDRYEISETRDRNQGDKSPALKWEKADSPYVLADQDLRSVIRVKAMDKAGNERIATYTPAAKDSRKDNRFVLWLVGTATLLFVLLRFIRFIPL